MLRFGVQRIVATTLRQPTMAVSAVKTHTLHTTALRPAAECMKAVSFVSSPLGVVARFMNRNARWPKKVDREHMFVCVNLLISICVTIQQANHGKRPCSHARRRMKNKMIQSRSMKKKIFGFW
jgi:hypothetical protein